MSSQGSHIFSGFRALGFYCNHVPLALRYHKKHRDHYVVTAVGKAFHTYNCSKLGIVSVSNSHPDDITCLAVDAFLVYTGCHNIIRAFANGRQIIHTYEGHVSDVHLLLPFGEHLVSVDEDSQLKIWDIKSTEIYLELSFDNLAFCITAIMHPTTYLNKILLGSRQGTMQLWNIKTNKLIYTFQGWGAPISVIEQAPAVDVVAVGHVDGTVIVHNLKFDETIITFKQEWGPVTAIAFRTDGQPIMATGSTLGHIALWNLEEKRLQAQMRNAHRESIAGMAFLQSEPVMITNSSDNHIKMWILDQADGSGRQLRVRSGHSSPPTRIHFHGNKGQNILSAGQDSSLKSFSTVHENQNKDLGQAYYNRVLGKKKKAKLEHLKMPPITAFVSETSRESDWDGIVACHQQLPLVTTWNYQRCTMGKHKLAHDRFKGQDNVIATAVDITSCGNFVVIGWSTGHVDTYNIQSGLHRGTFGQPTAHSGSVRGVAIDGLNQVTVTGSADQTVKFWKFKTKHLLHTLDIESPVCQMLLHRESSMLAVNTDDFTVHVVDVELRRVVRRFSGHQNKITDLTFSQDARWLVSSSMDCTVRTWDMPTGRLVDCFLLDSAATSIALSPTGDFLASTHIDDLGVYLWSNKTLYSHVSLRPLPSDYTPTMVALPGTSYQVKQETDEDMEPSDEAAEPMEEEFQSPDQISRDLVTLSTLPNSRWQSLIHLDVIKKRNKPTEPPKVPKAAPFFLPTIAGLTPTFAAPEEENDEPSAKRLKRAFIGMKSDLYKALEHASETEKYEPVVDYLKKLNPSSIDIEIRSLSYEDTGSTQAMQHFIAFLRHIFSTNQNFEIAQAYLGLFLKLHGNTLSKDTSLVTTLSELAEDQSSSWLRVQKEFNQSLCLINFLKNAAL
ncbi:WD repeat-containing protein 36-like [Amphiura filiformis]|uniref:WD repeat-containing protein 36-like n=1 Tax=Amphiura filiformis TaxID=82378 RepID=UPI003B223D13